jgi:hypothetical protein
MIFTLIPTTVFAHNPKFTQTTLNSAGGSVDRANTDFSLPNC